MFSFLIEIVGFFAVIIVLIFFGLVVYLILRYSAKKAKLLSEKFKSEIEEVDEISKDIEILKAKYRKAISKKRFSEARLILKRISKLEKEREKLFEK